MTEGAGGQGKLFAQKHYFNLDYACWCVMLG